MASSSDEESGPDAGETWDDFDGSGAEEEEQARRGGGGMSRLTCHASLRLTGLGVPAAGHERACRLTARPPRAQATRCLFSDDVLASPAAALARAAEAYGFDFLALRKARPPRLRAQASRRNSCRDDGADALRARTQELSLDFYDCIRVINFVRTQASAASASLTLCACSLPHPRAC
jgi:hypothetical protein